IFIGDRALLTAILLKHTLIHALPGLQQQQILESVLMSVEALISFRRRYRGRMNIISGLDLLMLDASNPRSLIYQIDRLRKYLLDLPRQDGQTSSLTSDMRPIMKSLTDIQLAELDMLAQVDEQTELRGKLDTLMTQIISQLEQFTTLLSDKYFDHADGPQQLINAQWKTDL
ncbi:alpha-E domain-containing protein, partial [Raoultella sp. Ech2A]|uniref:alpha-E domain-containing protein n=1 Tax=Raoultella sp. Ech2A TaxID=2996539 RepID=UPI0024C0C56F